MDAKTVFTKTAKGVTQVNQKTQSLSRQLTKVLKAIDGRSTITALSDKVDLAIPALEKDLVQLKKEGFIKVFEVKVEAPMSEFGGDDDDFDFTAPAKMAPALKEPVAAFGPSKFRAAGLNEQVARADAPAPSPPPKLDEAAQIAATLAARRKEEEDARIAAEALAAARAAAQKAQVEARARAEREAQIRARLEVEARARKEAEQRAIEEAKRAEEAAAKSRADLESKLAEEAKKRAETAASTQRLTEAQQAEQIAAQKALSEARAKAEAEAKAFAAARAKIEIEAKALSEARAQAEAASKRQEEELASAQRALRTQLKAEIEAKVRAEMEVLLKSDIEESGRAEVEAAVREEARDEARRRLEEQLATERSSLAKVEAEAKERAEIDAKRMLADQEARLRAEMDARLAEIAAEKKQVEIEARKMVEAQAAAAAQAAAEFAARLKAEEDARRIAEAEAEARRQRDEAERQRLEAIAREEAVARAKAAAEAKAAADAAAAMEERLKAEAAARAQVEADAEERRKSEALRATRLEARAREEAEERQKAEAEMQAKLSAEKQARIEAQAKALVEAEMREKALRESEVELESAKRAREEAEERATREAKAREIASRAVEQQVAEKEKLAALAEQRLAEEREARERAEAKAYADERAEEEYRLGQVARLKELAEQAERQANQPAETTADGKRKRFKPKKEVPVGRIVAFGAVALVVLAVVGIQLVPLGSVNAKLEKALTAWAHDDVSSTNLRVSLFPKPHVKLDQVALGKAFDAKAGSGKLYMDIGSIFGDKFVIDSMELNDVSVSAEALPRALKWADGEGRGSQIEIDRVILTNVKLDVKGVTLEPFDAELKFDRKGKIIRGAARTRDGKWSVETFVDTTNPPPEGGVQPWTVDFAARNWTPPIGPGIAFAVLAGKGSWADNQIVFPEMEAKLLEGSGKGNLKITLPSAAQSKGQLAAQAEFSVERVKVDQLVGTFTRDIAVSGRMEGTFAATASASSIGALLDSPTIAGAFQVREGTMSNVDLVQAMRNPGSVGGQTKYAELTSKLRLNDNVLRLEGLKLSGGVLFAGGNVGIALGKGTLSGSVTAEIRSNVAQDRAVFGLSGTVARPTLKRGG
jgi:hypothetical protein